VSSVEILVSPVKCQILTLDSGLIQQLDEKFKVKDNSKQFSPKIKELIRKGLADEYKHFFSKKTCRLPVGFLQEAKEFIEEKGFEVTVDDMREYPAIVIPDNYNDLIKDPEKEFRYYQIEALDRITKDKQLSGIIEGATAFGKTMVFLALCKMITDRILIIFPGKDLVFQTFKEAKKFGIEDIGLISGASINHGKRVMLCNFQSLEKLEGFENYKSFKTVFIDEMHSAKAGTIFKFLKKVPASIRIGFSATPFKPTSDGALDNALNKANLGEIIYSKKAKALMDEGFISQVEIRFLKVDQPSHSNYTAFHTKAVDDYIVRNDYRNNLIKRIVESSDKLTLIIVQRREHGEILERLIPSSKSYLHGDVKPQHRSLIQKQFNEGKVRVVITTVIWTQGIDIPNLERLIVAGAGKSFYQTIQRIGRGLRKNEKKTFLEVYDFIDETNKTLYKWSKDRWRYYNSEEYPIKAIKNDEI
jgi:superfamily II DNA or RNA helicase